MTRRLEEPKARSLAAALLAVGAHAHVLGGGFVWLDHGDLEAGAALAPPSQWLSLFTHGFARTGFYRPLAALSLSFDALWGGAPLAFHLHALLLHAVVAVAVGFAGEALGLHRRAALAAALLFASHPVGGMVGGLLAFRPELLLSGALVWLVWAAKERRALLCAALLLVAGLSKETGLVLGPLFLLALHPGARVLFTAAVGWAGALSLRLAFAPPWHAAPAPLQGLEAVGTRLSALARGVAALLVPWQTDWCDATTVTAFSWPGALALLGVCALAWLRRPAGLLFAASLLPALNLVPAPRFWSLHYFYLPLAFAVLLVGARGTRWLLALAMVWVGFSWLDFGRTRDDGSLWANGCKEGQLYLGDLHRQAGELEAAAWAYEAATERPRSPRAESRGHSQGLDFGRPERTRPPPSARVLSYSDEAAAFQNLGLLRLQQGRLDEAQGALEASLQRQPDALERRKLNHDLAAVSFARGDLAEVERRLAPEAARPDGLRESLDLLQRARALAPSPPK